MTFRESTINKIVCELYLKYAKAIIATGLVEKTFLF